MMIIFNFLPLFLLCVYPCSCFQKCLNLTGCHSQLLHTFMDSFQGCFRERPRDCRYFAGFYIFLRVANFAILSVLDNILYFWGISLTFILAVVMLAVCKPYKISKRNVMDIVLLSLSTIFFTTFNAYIESMYVLPISATLIYTKTHGFFFILSCFLPLYGVYLMLYQVGRLACRVTGCHRLKLFSLRKRGKTSPCWLPSLNLVQVGIYRLSRPYAAFIIS